MSTPTVKTTTTTEPAVPVRTCVGCRQRRPQPDLVRLAASDGRLVPGAGVPGRGAWLCRSTAAECFDQAAAGRRLGRALRSEIAPASLDAVRDWLATQVTRGTTERGGTGKVSLLPAR